MRYLTTFFVSMLLLAAVQVHAGPVDINSADAAGLAAAIVGIGEKKAASIIAYREANGPFVRIEDLVLVKGIGPATIEKNRHNLTVAPDSR
jgi:competence protein ComEA